MIDQAILAVKIKAAEDRLAYLRSLLPKPVPAAAVAPVEPAANDAPEVKRGPGRPRKAA